MNPHENPQNSKRQASFNLDESQSSSVSIKIYNRNEDDVVIRLYRNKKKSNRGKLRNSVGNPRSSARRSSAGKDKTKPTMLRNFYRNTFGPTLDETVLVGIETFQICKQNAQALNTVITSNENLRRNGSIIPNELSWDDSSLLPTNTNANQFETNGRQFESVCTNTSNCELDKEKNLSPLVTNQYQYSPFSNEKGTVLCNLNCPDKMNYPQSTESNRKDEKYRCINDTTSDDNLSKHISSESINASYQTDITRSTITDSKHDTNKSLASTSSCFGIEDLRYIVSELDSRLSSDDVEIYLSEPGTLNIEEYSECTNNITKQSYLDHESEVQNAESDLSTSSCSENCILCREELMKKPCSLPQKIDKSQTELKVLYASNSLLKNNSFKKDKKSYSTSAAPIYTTNVRSKFSFPKIKKSKSHPCRNLVKLLTSFLSERSRGSTAITSTVDTTLESSIPPPKNEQLILVSTQLPNESPKQTKNLKVVELSEISSWERQKSYPTARFIQTKIKKPLFKRHDRLTAGSDRPSKVLTGSISASSWITHYSLKSNIKKLPNYKAREIYRDLHKVDNRSVFKAKHILSTSSSSNFSTSSSISSSTWAPVVRLKSGTCSSINVNNKMLAPLESVTESKSGNLIVVGKKRLNNSDILLPPNESFVQDSSIYTKTTTAGGSPMQQKRNSIGFKPDGDTDDAKLHSKETKNEKNSVPTTLPKEVYCKSTDVIFTSDQSTAGICPNMHKTNNSCDYHKKDRTERKPLLEKLVDVFSEYSKRSSLPTYCSCNKSSLHSDQKRRQNAPQRTPILQRLFEVFSKKNLEYPPGSSIGYFKNRCECKRPRTQSDNRRSSFNENKETTNYSTDSLFRENLKTSGEVSDIPTRKTSKLPCFKMNKQTETKRKSSEDFEKSRTFSQNQPRVNGKKNSIQVEETKKSSTSIEKEPEKLNSDVFEEKRRCHKLLEKYTETKPCQLDSCENLHPTNAKQCTKMQNLGASEQKKICTCLAKKRNPPKEEEVTKDESSEEGLSRGTRTPSTVSFGLDENTRGRSSSAGILSCTPSLSLRSSSNEASLKSSEAKDVACLYKTNCQAFMVQKQHKGKRLNGNIQITMKKPKVNNNSEREDQLVKKKVKQKTVKEKKVKKCIDIKCKNDDNSKGTEICAKLNNLLRKGVQTKINDLSTKNKKPLMWRSFTESKYTKDEATPSPIRKPCKHKQQTEKEQKQIENLQNSSYRKCSICSIQFNHPANKKPLNLDSVQEKTLVDFKEVDEENKLNVCAFRDCSAEKPFTIQKGKKCKEAITNNRIAGGCRRDSSEMKTAKADAGNNTLVLKNKYRPSHEMDLSENNNCKDNPSYPKSRTTRQFSTKAAPIEQCEKPLLGICRCKKGSPCRNDCPQETRYAITRVTKYDDYTTYEILKSTRAKPKKIPEVLEKIFIEKDQ